MAAQLARQPRAVLRLIALHQADPETGRCVTCTLPGHGIPGTPHPCGPFMIATEAARLIALRPAG